VLDALAARKSAPSRRDNVDPTGSMIGKPVANIALPIDHTKPAIVESISSGVAPLLDHLDELPSSF